ncbi:MAG: NAD-dependent epimerase/dehydratase family protein [Saprospiraceae bacterium]|nr:NAD-dependent epimerase/dehydratase family protein [Saprospiraceae bacterium]
MMEKPIVLVTGANGFIGSHIVERMANEGYSVRGLVRKNSDLSLLEGINVNLVYGDVTDAVSLASAVDGVSIVIHNAGLASDWGPLELFMKINFEGTKNLALAAEKAGVKRFVLLSSVAIHGFGAPGMIDENAPINTQGFHYSISKWEAEKWLMSHFKSSTMEVTAIRPGNVFGPKDHTFIEKYLDIMVQGKGGYVNGGMSKTCPVYVGNLTKAIALAATHDQAVGEAFIITDGLDITWKQFTEKLAAALGIKNPSMSIPFSIGNIIAGMMESVYLFFNIKNAPLLTKYRMNNGGKDYYFSIDKAKRILGFVPETDLDSAISNTIAWYKGKHGIK